MSKVIHLASDLMLSGTVSAFAKQNECEFVPVSSAGGAVDAADSETLLIVDLGLQGLDVAQLSSLPKEVLDRAVAYGPHVHVAKLEAARSAGIAHVISRGQFSRDVGTIITGFAAG